MKNSILGLVAIGALIAGLASARRAELDSGKGPEIGRWSGNEMEIFRAPVSNRWKAGSQLGGREPGSRRTGVLSFFGVPFQAI